MTEPAVPDERPSYWAECERMTHAELDRFLRNAESRLSGPSVPEDVNWPRSRQEFLDLCNLMRVKVDAQKQDTTIPPAPEYHGPPGPGPFSPSRDLDELYSWLDNERRRLDEAREGGHTGVYVEYLEQQVAKLEAQIAPIERREEERHAERVREYDQAREPFRSRYRAWQKEISKTAVKQEANDKLEAFVERAYSGYDRLFTSRRSPGARGPITLDFEILPPGERTEEHIRLYYGEVLSRGRLKRFSRDRLDKLLALPWTGWQKGTAGFYGYMAMTFDTTDKILLECPVEGNAIYVLKPGEQGSLRKGVSKQELLDSGKANKIIHAGRWYERLKNELGIE